MDKKKVNEEEVLAALARIETDINLIGAYGGATGVAVALAIDLGESTRILTAAGGKGSTVRKGLRALFRDNPLLVKVVESALK